MKKLLSLTCTLLLGATLATPLLAQNTGTPQDWASVVNALETSDVDSFTSNKIKYEYMLSAIVNNDYRALQTALEQGINPLVHRELNATLKHNKYLPLLAIVVMIDNQKTYDIFYNAIPEDQQESAMAEVLAIMPKK